MGIIEDIPKEIFKENVALLPDNKKPGFPYCLKKNDGFKCTKPQGHEDNLHCAVGILGYVRHEWEEKSD